MPKHKLRKRTDCSRGVFESPRQRARAACLEDDGRGSLARVPPPGRGGGERRGCSTGRLKPIHSLVGWAQVKVHAEAMFFRALLLVGFAKPE